MSRLAPPPLRTPWVLLTLAAMILSFLPGTIRADDRLKELQTEYANTASEKQTRVYHFGSQGPGDVFSNHASHSNRQVPVYVFGKKADLGPYTGANSSYRDPEKLKKLYGFVPENTVNPEAEYGDQSDLYRVMKDAAGKGVKHIFIVWFDGLDWPTTQAATIVKANKVFTEGKGSGLIFQDYKADGTAQYGYVVTSPTYDKSVRDLDAQTVSIPKDSLRGGYDVLIAGPNPWIPGPLSGKAPGYFKGQGGHDGDIKGVADAGRKRHAYTDSSTSAAEVASGVKSYNGSVNVGDDGRLIPTIFHQLQAEGWKAGTVTSVPFCHASPAAMYGQNVYRGDYQDLARCMFGLPGILQETHNAPLLPGLEVVIGTGYGVRLDPKQAKSQGNNTAADHTFLADADRKAIDVKNGGKYRVVKTEIGTNGGEALLEAAEDAAAKNLRLFGWYGTKKMGHLPFRTADGRFDPSPDPGKSGKPPVAESYTPAELESQPTLAQMTDAALTVLAKPDQKFILFVEAGDVDFGLHANNLDNAVGAVYSGEDAIKRIIHWVETQSNWDDTMLLVSSDHGHYMVLDDPHGLLAPAK